MNKNTISNPFFTIIILFIFYSFGAFGLLNLFHLKVQVQLILICLIVSLFLIINIKIPKQVYYSGILYSLLFSVGSFVYFGRLNSSIEGVIIIFCIFFFFIVPRNHIFSLAKAITITTSILSVFNVIVFLHFLRFPENMSYTTAFVYSAMDAGGDRISPNYFTDYFSFISGDGYSLSNTMMISRLKGYCTEPSGTIIYYLAPCIFGFMIGGRYVILSLFILIVNILCIASFTTLIIFTFSIVLFLLLFLFAKHFKFILTIGLFSMLFLLTSKNLVFSITTTLGDYFFSNFGFDLVSRKIGDESAKELTNLGARQLGITLGVKNLFTSPFGYSSSYLLAGAGLAYQTSSATGWVGVSILSLFFINMFSGSIDLNKKSKAIFYKYGISLFISISIIALFVNGYGWNRPPGLIFLLIMYMIISKKIAFR